MLATPFDTSCFEGLPLCCAFVNSIGALLGMLCGNNFWTPLQPFGN